jgi:hypothetical protein
MATRLWRIALIVETDDEAEVERLADVIGALACDVPSDQDHACRLPWFVITSELPEGEAESWRDDLNR